MKKRKCLECADEFIGRIDKKYCSDNCRSAYNNKMNSDLTEFARRVNRILRRNRRILSELNPCGKTKVHREELMELGFKFRYFTNQYRTKSGNIYHFCYDYGYIQLSNDYYRLVFKHEYIE
jgi:hypothetical protein